MDFGEVCAQSVCTQGVELTNGLPCFVWLQLEVDCDELRGSSPLSQVMAPRSRSTLPLTFQSSNLGPFIRSLSYSLNQRHSGQVLIQARVVPLSLELSSNLLVLNPAPSLVAQSGYRSSVTLRNRLNHAAEFTWQPVVTDNGILFSVRPATGASSPSGVPRSHLMFSRNRFGLLHTHIHIYCIYNWYLSWYLLICYQYE